MAEDSPKEIRPEDALHSLAQDKKADPQAALLAQLAKKEQQPPGETDIAAVLDDKAFKPRMGKEDALQAMAAGQWKDEQPPAPSGSDSEGEDTADVVDDGPASGQGRSLRARVPAAYGGGFKKFLVPPLIAAGLLLWVLGGVVAYMSAAGSLGPSSTLRTLMVVSAFPLGAFLMLGAWLFLSSRACYHGIALRPLDGLG